MARPENLPSHSQEDEAKRIAENLLRMTRKKLAEKMKRQDPVNSRRIAALLRKLTRSQK